MQFFSGFSLQNDEKFFREFIQESDFCVCGFSYGAIKAFEYTQQLLEEGKRVDTLQLFSPAFFKAEMRNLNVYRRCRLNAALMPTLNSL